MLLNQPIKEILILKEVHKQYVLWLNVHLITIKDEWNILALILCV